MAQRISWTRCGKDCLLVSFSDRDPDRSRRAARAVCQVAQTSPGDAVRDYVIAPTAAMVQFKLRPDQSVTEWADGLIHAIQRAASARQPRRHRKRIPITYSGRDLKRAAAEAGLPVDDFVQTHLKATYHVQAMGGSPGFAYLSGLDARLHLPPPSKTQSRAKAGSVVIAGADCMVLGADQVGPWYLIACTARPAFDPQRDPPFLLAPCDLIRFTTDEPAEGGD